jgi:hypothetical protein
VPPGFVDELHAMECWVQVIEIYDVSGTLNHDLYLRKWWDQQDVAAPKCK